MLVAEPLGTSDDLLTRMVVFDGLGVYAAKILAERTLVAASFALQNLFVPADRRWPS